MNKSTKFMLFILVTTLILFIAPIILTTTLINTIKQQNQEYIKITQDEKMKNLPKR